MKLILFTITLMFSLLAKAQENTPQLATYEGHYYYEISSESNSKLLIFLHGGVRNPHFQQNATSIEFDYLIEENHSFIETSSKNGFDILAPVVDDSINWLTNPNTTFNFLQKIIAKEGKKYRQIILSGHSDGGSGSFKLFYSHPNSFDGLVIFNGYPQNNNFAKKVDYATVTNKKIVFYTTFKDETIPYEFSLTEYCKQKQHNANTYFYVREGNHGFGNYQETDFTQLFDILSEKTNNLTTETTPMHGLTLNDKLIDFYPFRKMIVRKFAYGSSFFEENRIQLKKLNKK